uniref:Small integral membrane protein 19 n=1 Tax=Piliocolobus tephrosceles TaxID=591936 RepID=A0A8C9IS85_9PRIM
QCYSILAKSSFENTTVSATHHLGRGKWKASLDNRRFLKSTREYEKGLYALKTKKEILCAAQLHRARWDNIHDPSPAESRPTRAQRSRRRRAFAGNAGSLTLPSSFRKGAARQATARSTWASRRGARNPPPPLAPPAPASPAPTRGSPGVRAGGLRGAARAARAGVAAGEGKGARLHSRARGRHRDRSCVSPAQKTEKGKEGGKKKKKKRPDSSFHPETDRPAGNDEGRGRPGPLGNRFPRARPRLREKRAPEQSSAAHVPPPELAANKRRIMRIFSVPPTEETLSEPNFYDTISKIRLRQQLEMYSISRKYDYQQPQNQADSVQLSLE